MPSSPSGNKAKTTRVAMEVARDVRSIQKTSARGRKIQFGEWQEAGEGRKIEIKNS